VWVAIFETGRALVFVTFEGGRSINDSAIHSESLIPKVGLEPTRMLPHRILSPVRLPFPWYWEHVGATLKASSFKAVTMLPPPTYIIAALG
jgi:hypothetical protein